MMSRIASTVGVHAYFRRTLTTTQTATALRPFLFAVHPDLFGRYPKEQAVNEQSLKLFNQYVENLLTRRRPSTQPLHLTFYMRVYTRSKTSDKVSLTNNNSIEESGELTKEPNTMQDASDIKPVRLTLKSDSVLETVRSVLLSCSLPLDYINSLSPSCPDSIHVHKFADEIEVDINFFHGMFGTARHGNSSTTTEPNSRQRLSRYTLNSWLQNNIKSANEKRFQMLPVMEDIKKLIYELKQLTGLSDVCWKSGWALTFFRTSLKRLMKICCQSRLTDCFKGRTIVFANGAGVCIRGLIILRYDDVPENWTQTLQSVWKQDEILRNRVPVAEARLSSLLNGGRIGRQSDSSHDPPFLLVEDYLFQLEKLTASLRDFKARDRQASRIHVDLTDIDIIVDCATGPLMISQNGSILISSSSNAHGIIQYLNEQACRARRIKAEYMRLDSEHRSLVEQCRETLKLETLTHESNVTRSQMQSCCSRLLQLSQRSALLVDLSHCQLTIAQFYSVMATGNMCIPWNFEDVL